MKFLSIKKTAEMPECPVNEYFLRGMAKRGECPGFYSGSRFLINTAALFAMLEQRSLEPIQGREAAALASDPPGA